MPHIIGSNTLPDIASSGSKFPDMRIGDTSVGERLQDGLNCFPLFGTSFHSGTTKSRAFPL